MAMSPRLMRPFASVAYHPEALAWQTAVLANGGTVGSSLKPVSDFCKAIDAAGIRSKFLRLNLFVGGNLSAARVPLYRGASPTGTQYGGSVDVNNGPFVSGDYSEATGLTGNGTTKYLDTGLTMGTLTTFGMSIDDDHWCAYVRSSAKSGAAYGGAIYNGEPAPTCYAMYDASGSTQFKSGDTGTDRLVYGTRTAYGMFFGQFSSSTAGVVLQNDSNITSFVINNYPVAFETAPKVFVFAVGDEYGTVFDITSACMSAYSIGKSMTSGQRTSYYNAMLTLQTALGRNV